MQHYPRPDRNRTSQNYATGARFELVWCANTIRVLGACVLNRYSNSQGRPLGELVATDLAPEVDRSSTIELYQDVLLRTGNCHLDAHGGAAMARIHFNRERTRNRACYCRATSRSGAVVLMSGDQFLEGIGVRRTTADNWTTNLRK